MHSSVPRSVVIKQQITSSVSSLFHLSSITAPPSPCCLSLPLFLLCLHRLHLHLMPTLHVALLSLDLLPLLPLAQPGLLSLLLASSLIQSCPSLPRRFGLELSLGSVTFKKLLIKFCCSSHYRRRRGGVEGWDREQGEAGEGDGGEWAQKTAGTERSEAGRGSQNTSNKHFMSQTGSITTWVATSKQIRHTSR